ncbi:MAG: hypothetical protein WA871_04825 [Candidatus Acidiferrales bacterium]
MPADLRCQIIECQRDVAPALAVHGVCVGHFLEMVLVRLDVALVLCQEGKPVEAGQFDWLLSQGDFAARALAKDGGAADPVERTRLLELLLCLANLHEYAQQHSIDATLPSPLGLVAGAR